MTSADESARPDGSMVADLERLAHIADGEQHVTEVRRNESADSDTAAEPQPEESAVPDTAAQPQPEEPAVPDTAVTPDAPSASTTASEQQEQPAGPHISADARAAFLHRWNDIQIGFVDDPGTAVRQADSLVTDVADAYRAAVDEQRKHLSGGDSTAASDTEALRLAVVGYRTMLRAMLHD